MLKMKATPVQRKAFRVLHKSAGWVRIAKRGALALGQERRLQSPPWVCEASKVSFLLGLSILKWGPAHKALLEVGAPASGSS